jgi:hypothetical protein
MRRGNLGQSAAAYADFTPSAQNLMYKPNMQNAFNITGRATVPDTGTIDLATPPIARALGSRFAILGKAVQTARTV